MSKIWSGETTDAATPVSSWVAFNTGSGSDNFRALYAGDRGSPSWSMTFPGERSPATEGPSATDLSQDLVDPIEAAAQEAFVQGFQEGERVTRDALERDEAARADLAAAIQSLARVDEGSFATLLSEAVIRLVGQIIGEVPIDADVLQARCEAVAACIDNDETRAQIEVNPEDLPLLEGGAASVALVPNPNLPRGSVRLATADGWIEDGPDVRLARLKALMDDMEGRL